VRIDTGDARARPYADDSFDVVLSHWVVHNLEEASDRLRVLDEMWRVLRPGGVLALADIAFVLAYREHFSALGASPIQCLDGGLEARLMGLLSGGSYRPQSLLAVKPVNPATPQP
jgi:SAM-dependent methyltransferase